MGNSSTKAKKSSNVNKQNELTDDSNTTINDVYVSNLIQKININKDNKEWLFNYFIIEWYNVNKNYNVLLKKNLIINLLVNHLDNFFEPILKKMFLAICGYVNDNIKGLLDSIINYSIASFNLYLNSLGIKLCKDEFILNLLNTMCESSSKYVSNKKEKNEKIEEVKKDENIIENKI